MKPEFKPYTYTHRTDVGTIRMTVDLMGDNLDISKNKLSCRGCEPDGIMSERLLKRREREPRGTGESYRSVDSRYTNTRRRSNEDHYEP
jgi:hypothetical protein